MSLHRRAARRDANHGDCAKALERVGFHVRSLSAAGVCDLLVWRTGGPFILIEVKTAEGRLTPAQVTFVAETEGCPVAIVTGPSEAVSVAQRLHLAWAQRP